MLKLLPFGVDILQKKIHITFAFTYNNGLFESNTLKSQKINIWNEIQTNPHISKYPILNTCMLDCNIVNGDVSTP